MQDLILNLIKKFGYWNDHPDVPLEDWQYEVTNGDTRTSYWEYVGKMIDDRDN